jgi:DNA-binding CsgD family transcriptional regulator/PAS domain-containing protein
MAWGIDPVEEARYAQHYGALDPHRRLATGWPSGSVLISHEHFDDDFVGSSEFYQDFLIPAGSGHVAGVRLTGLADRLILLGLHRNRMREPFLQPEQATLAQLTPHLTRAADLHERLEPLRRHADAMARALDALAQGAIVADRGGRVVLLNRAAEDLLRAADGLSLREGRLIACGAQAADALAQALAQATLPLARVRKVSALTLRRAACPQRLLVLVVPLPERVALASFTEPAAFVLIEDPTRERNFAPDLLRQLFGLSPAEAALAVELLRGKRVDEVAAVRGVRMPTVRTQLQSVLAKTGCERQSDLVRRLGALLTVRQVLEQNRD